ncbi:substrate-binding domain-containing protein [Emticicia sp. CRIBPO]|uniref:LacI family DNA-binding transcriptional regulator n=1 Tax=Emticicia sp. CRIBPO TaxID=2683258 RepID=UPI00141211AD|nr:LacI family DNA-binding transcriptional regulator [Emticicia sp. CRIBPO]NBA88381.1 substrate-binding domain-containing protein [Emticicia sp. CRIBPO]
MEPITIKDIAKALNISTSTVSRALRGSYEINTETKKLVMEYAEKMNYRPNPIALSLKENRSRAIGVIVPEIANNFFSQAINGIENIAYNRGYHVVIFQSHESYEREMVNVQHLFARKVDGLLISLSGSTRDVNHIENYRENNFPVVYFDRVPEITDAHKVVADNFDGAFRATEYMIQQGKRTIAHITSPPVLSITQERLAGYKAALEKYGLPIREELIKFCYFSPEEAFNAIDSLIKNYQPDAFFTASDRLALNCYEAHKKKIIELPKDVMFFGFTNLNVAHLLEPPLSTIVQPALELGQTAAEILLDIIENKRRGKGYETIKLKTDLHIR